jgi:hypothetical protein
MISRLMREGGGCFVRVDVKDWPWVQALFRPVLFTLVLYTCLVGDDRERKKEIEIEIERERETLTSNHVNKLYIMSEIGKRDQRLVI